jgi:hypothetical protein
VSGRVKGSQSIEELIGGVLQVQQIVDCFQPRPMFASDVRIWMWWVHECLARISVGRIGSVELIRTHSGVLVVSGKDKDLSD